MRYARNVNPIADPVLGASSNARQHGRIRCRHLRCSLGDVVDVSGSGLRVQRRGRLPITEGQLCDLMIEGLDGPFMVRVRAVWIRKIGWRTREIGLRYEDLSESARRHLGAIVRAAPYEGGLASGASDAAA